MIDLDDVLAHAHDNCVACEGTGVVRCWSPGGPCPDGQTVCESCGPCQQSDVDDLVALVRAKQSWIDGAKVDMAAMEEELAKALAAIALAGEEIERASVEVKRADRQRDDARAAIAAVRVLDSATFLAALARYRGSPEDQADYIVDIIAAALAVRHDPSATTDGGAG